MTVKAAAELGLQRWARVAVRRRWTIIVLMSALALGFGSQLPKLRAETSSESYLKPDDPGRILYDRFREQFGRDTKIAIGIDPPEVFSLAFLERLKEFHETIENEVPLLVEVTSLINIRNTRGEGDHLIVEDLLEDFPQSQEEVDRLEARVMANPLYQDFLISRDGSFTSIVVETQAYSSLGAEDETLGGFDDQAEAPSAEAPPFLTGEENAEIVVALQKVVDRFDAPDFRIYATGNPIVVEYLQARIREGMARFTGIALVVIAAFLFVLFRRVAGVVLPLLIVSLSLVTTLGVMAVTGIPITVPTQILPSFLLSVGVGYSVHLLVIFLQAYDRGASREASLVHAFSHSGISIVMSAITTSAGLFSFTTADLTHIAVFGVVAPLGVGLSLLFSLALLPALIAVVPIRRHASPPRGASPGRTDRALQAAGRACNHHPRAVVLTAATLTLVAAAGTTKLRVSHNPLEWFGEDTPIRVAAETIDERLGGSLPMEVLIETGVENGIQDPSVMYGIQAMHDRVRRYAEEGLTVGKATSIVDVVRETHQALNENRPEFYRVPQSRGVIAQELLLFENSGSDDLEEVVDSRFSLARLTIRMPDGDAADRRELIEEASVELPRALDGHARVTLTGLSVLMNRTMDAVIYSLSRSYILALILITPLMMWFIGSLRRGLVSMVPNLLPILLCLGFMGWARIPLDIFTLLIGCIAIGLAVDDTIHFIHGFQGRWLEHGDPALAISETLQTTGKALLFTSVVLSAGFFIFMLSSLKNLVSFGLLTGFVILMAFIADITVTPALLTLVSKNSRSRRSGGG